ncbi:MAG: hypothetical protein D6816_15330 [Bacteroidetes bacterium]|nr:MAG: hypothetical protein D6816_15330 [Bacteroidota bacterium]
MKGFLEGFWEICEIPSSVQSVIQTKEKEVRIADETDFWIALIGVRGRRAGGRRPGDRAPAGPHASGVLDLSHSSD